MNTQLAKKEPGFWARLLPNWIEYGIKSPINRPDLAHLYAANIAPPQLPVDTSPFPLLLESTRQPRLQTVTPLPLMECRIEWQMAAGPRPWSVKPNTSPRANVEPYWIMDASGNVVATLNRPMYCADEACLANAEMIVRAVNSLSVER